MTRPAGSPAPDTLKVVDDWIHLGVERARDRGGPTSKSRVGSVLRFLGLPYENDRQIEHQEAIRDSIHHFIFKHPPETIAAVRGAPQFGFQSNGTYHVFCLWEDARLDFLINNQAVKSSDNAVIVLYLAALTEAERQDFRRRSWAEDVTVAVLDEILLEFLTRRNDGTRLQDFLAATLPYTAANPYNPETDGWGARVAPEMFYGREEMADSLTAMRGTSIVFGGRQLGKTALLRHVERTFAQPGQKRFAWFIDLKAMGYVPVIEQEGRKEPAGIFQILHDHFRSAGILENGIADGSLDEIRQDVLGAFKDDQDLRVLAMFDESDAFLESDAAAGLVVVESMRSLMDRTDNRFKVVFAGLHNVQRFAGKPNNPFPNLGFNPNIPRRGGIGPLRDREARQLVEQPLNLLGFRFQPLAVDRLLSYTNRHPSLIQFFCHELIQSWRRNNPDGHPPFEIGTTDVDSVSRTKTIQEGIRRRFEETFKLDPRYHVISLAMIRYQDRPTQKWSLDQIRDVCECYWPLTFDKENLDDLELTSLLNELIGLGILAEDGTSYRMRNSLIPQMFGIEIDRKLKELEDSEPFHVLETG